MFSNIVLADEINRTPPKTQAALLEAMQERSVTVSGVSHVLRQTILRIGYSNPIEQKEHIRFPKHNWIDYVQYSFWIIQPYDQEVAVVKDYFK